MKKTGLLMFIGILLVSVTCCAFAFHLKENEQHEEKNIVSKLTKLIIDSDGGPDDALAILLTLKFQKITPLFDIVAITSVYGNAYLEDVELNILKILAMANITGIPVYAGSKKPLINNFTTTDYFGKDGFGDFNFTKKLTTKVDRSMHAAMAMIELAKKYSGELSILALGPLTNIALAMTLDSEFVGNVKRFYIMGGSVYGIGNISPGVEFNFSLDPESNYIVFNALKERQALSIPLEVNKNMNIPMTWRKIEFGTIDSELIKFLNQAEKKGMNTSSWISCDGLAAAVMMWPTLIEKIDTTNITPMMCGEGRGGLLVDREDLTSKPKNVEIVEKVNVDDFKKILINLLS